MQQKGNLFSILEILSRLSNILLIIVLYIMWGRKYEIIVYATVGSTIILLIIAILNEKNFWSVNRNIKSSIQHTKKEIISYGMPLVLTVLITWLFQSFDKMAIKHWSNFTELGLYAAAFKVVALLNVFQTTFTTFWTPVALEKFHDEKNSEDFFSKISNLVSFIMLLIAILSIAGKDIIIILLGNNYEESARIMPFLVFMPVMYTISETTVIGINFYKKNNDHILIAVITCLLNIMGNGILVPKYGAIGASISTAISYIVFFFLRTLLSLKYYKVSYKLNRLLISIFVVFAYAAMSLSIQNYFHSIVLGAIFTFIHMYIYKKEVSNSYSLIKNILKRLFHKN